MVDAVLVLVVGAALAVTVLLVLRRWIRHLNRRIGHLERSLEEGRRAAVKQRRQIERTAARSLAVNQESASRFEAAADRRFDALEGQLRRGVRAIRDGGLDDTAQIEAFVQLQRLADLREAIPRTRGWPVSPDALLVITDLIRRERPRVYLDLGSGTSTVVVASTARAIGLDLRVIGVDLSLIHI